MKKPRLLVFSRGRTFLRSDSTYRYYDNDGKFIDSISGEFESVTILSKGVRESDKNISWVKDYSHVFQSSNVRLVTYGESVLFLLFRELALFLRERKKCDVAYLFGPTGRMYFLSLLLFRKTKCCIYLGLRWGGAKNQLLGILEKLAVKKASVVYCAGPDIKDYICGLGLQRRVIETVPMVNILGDGVPREYGSEVCLKVLMVGSLIPRKDFGTMFKALRVLECKFEGCVKLDILGAGDVDAFKEEHLEVLVGLSSNIDFVGQVREEKLLRAYFESADLLVMSSLDEGVPRVIYEAFSFGLPVISTPLPGVKKVFGDVGAISYFDFGDSERLAEILMELSLNKQEMRLMSQSAAETHKAKLCISSVDQIRSFLEEEGLS